MDVKVRIYIQISIPKINQETQKKAGERENIGCVIECARSVDHVCEKLQPKCLSLLTSLIAVYTPNRPIDWVQYL